MSHLSIRLICCSLLSVIAAPAAAQEFAVSSPDSKNHIAAVYDANTGTLSYRITRNGQPIIAPTPISITINGVALPGKTTASSEQSQHDGVTEPVLPTIDSTIRDKYFARTIRFASGARLELRAYDDGVAFRWAFEGAEQIERKIYAENLAFNFAKDFQIYFPQPQAPQPFFSHQEPTFDKVAISQTAGKTMACTPALVELGSAEYLLITDVNVVQYPGMWLEGTSTTTMKSVFPKFPARIQLDDDRNQRVAERADYLAVRAGGPPPSFMAPATGSATAAATAVSVAATLPWRAFVLADASGLLKSTMLYNLATPAKGTKEDWSWVRPGKVAWDWWNASTLTDVDFRAGINQATYKAFIDFASANGLEYVILDEGWSTPGGTENLLKVVPALDIAELSAYAKSKNVGLILWITSAALEANFDAAFAKCKEWNIVGLKVDFMQRDDAPMMDFMYKVAERAAEEKLLVDFHGGSKPAGILRTWPNVISHESVLGLEHSKWGRGANPNLVMLQTFIRMTVGPMDYTPGAMVNKSREEFRSVFTAPMSQGTRCHQLGMYVVFLSPLQMLADTPSNYRKNPGSMEFLKDVPTVWDETRVIEAKVGETVVVARRRGETWYVGGLTNWSPRDVSAKLDFLPAGKKFQMTAWRDGLENATGDVAGKTEPVDATTTVEIKMSAGGGFAAVIRPAP